MMISSFRERLEHTYTLGDRVLTPSQELRIRPLMGEISKHAIKFKDFITLTYPYKNVSWKNTVKDISRVKFILKKFAKDPNLKAWFFIEKHLEGKHEGGYHIHLLIEDLFKVYDQSFQINSHERTTCPSRVMRSVLYSTSIEMLTMDRSVHMSFKQRLIRNALVKHCRFLADNEYSCVIQEEDDVRSRVSYCTKQFWNHGLEPSDIVDFTNSDIDSHIVNSWNKNDYFPINNSVKPY